MTNHEAIETLKANYPDACFEQLREAVDTAIFALQRSTHKALDTISIQDVIDVVKHAWTKGLEPTQYIEELPSAQPYTEEQLQKMQDLEQAEIEKAYELGRKDANAEIVRCKDCRWSDANEIGDLSECHHVRGLVNASPNGYCNFAERRTDD